MVELYSFVLYFTSLPNTVSAISLVVMSGLISRISRICFWFLERRTTSISPTNISLTDLFILHMNSTRIILVKKFQPKRPKYQSHQPNRQHTQLAPDFALYKRPHSQDLPHVSWLQRRTTTDRISKTHPVVLSHTPITKKQYDAVQTLLRGHRNGR
jgi:hypothetical protein